MQLVDLPLPGQQGAPELPQEVDAFKVAQLVEQVGLACSMC